MRTARLLAILLCLAAFGCGAAFMLGTAPVLGGLSAVGGLGLGIVAAQRPESHNARCRLTQSFLVYASALFVLGTIGLAVAPPVTVGDWVLAAGGIGGWFAARRQSRRRQLALLYMNYIRD